MNIFQSLSILRSDPISISRLLFMQKIFVITENIQCISRGNSIQCVQCTILIINSRHGNRARNRKLNDSTYLQKQSSFSRISRNEFEFVTRDGGQRTDFVIAVYRYHRITEASVRNLKWDDRLRVRIHICPFSIVRLNQDLLINSYVCV